MNFAAAAVTLINSGLPMEHKKLWEEWNQQNQKVV